MISHLIYVSSHIGLCVLINNFERERRNGLTYLGIKK